MCASSRNQAGLCKMQTILHGNPQGPGPFLTWLTLVGEQHFHFSQLSGDINHKTTISKNVTRFPTITMPTQGLHLRTENAPEIEFNLQPPELQSAPSSAHSAPVQAKNPTNHRPFPGSGGSSKAFFEDVPDFCCRHPLVWGLGWNRKESRPTFWGSPELLLKRPILEIQCTDRALESEKVLDGN